MENKTFEEKNEPGLNIDSPKWLQDIAGVLMLQLYEKCKN